MAERVERSSTAATAIRSDRELGRVLLRNTLTATGGAFIVKILNFAFTVYAVRLLGEVGWGQFAIVVSFVGLFSIFFELGLTQYTQREIAQDARRADELFWNLVAIRLLLAIAGMVVITGTAYQVRYEPLIIIGIALHTATFIPAAILAPLTTVLNAQERLDLTTHVQVLGQLLTIVFSLLFLMISPTMLSLAYGGAVTMVSQAALAAWLLRRHHLAIPAFGLAPNAWPRFIWLSLPFGLTTLALTFNFNVDTVILGYFRDSGEVGWYSAVYRLIFTVCGVSTGFLTALTPSFSREYVHDADRIARWSRASILGMALFTIPAAIGLFVLASPVVQLLYGEAFAPSAAALSIVAWDVPLLNFMALAGNVTTAMNRERPAMVIYFACALLNVALNVLFIPVYGLYAAAAVTIATDALAVLLFVLLLRGPLNLDAAAAPLLKTALAASAMGVIVWQAADLPLPVTIALGAISYAILVVLVRLIDPLMVWRRVSDLWSRAENTGRS
jgi:O-antigen/teichoic acid export membrane protein